MGRPFGGVGCLWRKNLSNSISMIQSNASHGRLISINLKFGSLDIIIANTYFPYYKHSMDYIIDTSSLVADIECVIKNKPNAKHIICGDFNFECIDGNVGYDLFKGLLSDYHLKCCDCLNVDPNLQYTYFHESLGQSSWLDHFFMSDSLFDMVSSFRILDNGTNL